MTSVASSHDFSAPAPHAHGARPPGDTHATQAPERLDDLLALDHAALSALYQAASVPRIADVAGDLRGRMLAIPALRGSIAARLLRRFAASGRFPWRGKTFTAGADGQAAAGGRGDAAAGTEDRGEGVNRVFTDRLRLFRFATSIGRSRAGDFDAVQLDYDRPQNPFFIRAIKDEIRELRPGLYLGQAWLQIGSRAPILGLWFGLER